MNTSAPEGFSWEKQKLLLLIVTTSLCVLVVMDANMVALSLPSISRSFHSDFNQLEWVISAYMITFAACLLPAGGLADLYGRRSVLMYGLLIFCVSSLVCGLAPNTQVLNIARAVQGVGAALQLTSALAIIANAFTDSASAYHAWALWGTCIGLTTCAAPVVGGIFTASLGWRSIFLVNVPLGIVIYFLVRRYVPESRSLVARPIDYTGSFLFAGMLALLIWALITAGAAGISAPTTKFKFAVSFALFVVFLVVENRRLHPMIDLGLFAMPRFSAGVVGMFAYAASAQVLLTFFPIYLQTWFRLSPMMAGAAMLPFAVAMVIGPSLGVRLGRGRSAHYLLSLGLVVVCAGDAASAYVVTSSHYFLVALVMAVVGLGAGILNGTTQRAIMNEAPVDRVGMISGIAQTTRFASIVMAVGVLGAVIAQRAHSTFSGQIAETLVPPAAAKAFVEKVLAGDVGHAASLVQGNAFPQALSVARTGSVAGFSSALLLSAGIAVVSAVLILLLISRAQPSRKAQTSKEAGSA